jgi:tellurite resistance protein TehA-like permease
MFFPSGILSFITAVMGAIFQPYKVRTHNTTDSVLLTLMGIHFVSYHAEVSLNYENVAVILTVQFLAIGQLLLYCISLLVWKLRSGKLQPL